MRSTRGTQPSLRIFWTTAKVDVWGALEAKKAIKWSLYTQERMHIVVYNFCFKMILAVVRVEVELRVGVVERVSNLYVDYTQEC
jgi:hypothetical protein